MPNAIVIADKNVGRRRAALEHIVRNAEIHQCDDSIALQKMVTDTAPAVVVIGSLGDGPTEVIEAAYLVRNLYPPAKVILIADFSSEAIAIGALRAGVFEYLKAPVDPMEIAEAVSRAIPPLDEAYDGFESLVGGSEPIQRIKELIVRIAPLNTTVLITGESGTGKEIVAGLIHQHSRRMRAPFVCVNCAAIPDSLIESALFGHERGAFTGAFSRQTGQIKNADKGTLFLDEIGDMSALAQSKMLRTLEQHEIQPLGSSRPVPIDIRLIAATHRDLERMVAEEKFRSDLYYRLHVSRVHIPPLRERPGDIPVLALHFVHEINRLYNLQLEGFTPTALQTLTGHDWPGNVRQLRHVIEAAAIVCTSNRISDHDLRTLHSFSVSGPPAVKTSSPVIPTRQLRPSKDLLLETLEATHWNMTKTAELLSWSRSTLYRQVARYKIERHRASLTETNPEFQKDAPDMPHGHLTTQ
jgi:DNA-binding NtrC family response regulator